jgi:hypothetical protein
MADSAAFAFVTQELERLTRMTRDEARGTVRIALRGSGLAASAVRVHELQVVLEKVLPRELASRRIEGSEDLCAEIRSRLGTVRDEAPAETPEAVFQRLGGS